MEYSTGFSLAVDAVNRHVNSARPDAPVRPEPTPRARLAPARHRTAAALHRLADAIQPRPVPAPPCAG
ncbi:hypothetical protein K7640_22515 [Micromonospora sp. PLK6-60]|uniref:hypothetical protein n=1 Tax=Micromonospora sp. PLK6-60 TaxID=2873383 RepID=UPI001CA762B0|nr:hypothetical protein [Micromonospora sp. PLK6-60]MBY8874606.1 hypothetical protein [Micromonospora sp. PLK6-60]